MVLQCFKKSKRWVFTTQYIYAYRQNVSGSITNRGGEHGLYNSFTIHKDEDDIINDRQYTTKEKKHYIRLLHTNFAFNPTVNKDAFENGLLVIQIRSWF